MVGAVVNGSFPGSWTEVNGRRNVHIPRKAFEDYMSKFSRSTSDELVIALADRIKRLSSKK